MGVLHKYRVVDGHQRGKGEAGGVAECTCPAHLRPELDPSTAQTSVREGDGLGAGGGAPGWVQLLTQALLPLPALPALSIWFPTPPGPSSHPLWGRGTTSLSFLLSSTPTFLGGRGDSPFHDEDPRGPMGEGEWRGPGRPWESLAWEVWGGKVTATSLGPPASPPDCALGLGATLPRPWRRSANGCRGTRSCWTSALRPSPGRRRRAYSMVSNGGHSRGGCQKWALLLAFGGVQGLAAHRTHPF